MRVRVRVRARARLRLRLRVMSRVAARVRLLKPHLPLHLQEFLHLVEHLQVALREHQLEPRLLARLREIGGGTPRSWELIEECRRSRRAQARGGTPRSCETSGAVTCRNCANSSSHLASAFACVSARCIPASCSLPSSPSVSFLTPSASLRTCVRARLRVGVEVEVGLGLGFSHGSGSGVGPRSRLLAMARPAPT